jgi:hypothetical protein
MREAHQGPKPLKDFTEWPDIWVQSDLVQNAESRCNGGWVHIGKVLIRDRTRYRFRKREVGKVGDACYMQIAYEGRYSQELGRPQPGRLSGDN